MQFARTFTFPPLSRLSARSTNEGRVFLILLTWTETHEDPKRENKTVFLHVSLPAAAGRRQPSPELMLSAIGLSLLIPPVGKPICLKQDANAHRRKAEPRLQQRHGGHVTNFWQIDMQSSGIIARFKFCFFGGANFSGLRGRQGEKKVIQSAAPGRMEVGIPVFQEDTQTPGR